MVIFDGERLVVSLIRGKNYKAVLELGKTSNNFEYFSDINAVALSPTKNNARKLFELGYPFDESAKIFLKKKKTEIDFKSVDGKFELYPFQKEGVKMMLHADDNILLADEMGLGKTPQASSYLHWKKESFPALVISPASLKENWKKEIKRWTGKDAYVI
jgi:SNF2 family DNA or RNA helicase